MSLVIAAAIIGSLSMITGVVSIANGLAGYRPKVVLFALSFANILSSMTTVLSVNSPYLSTLIVITLLILVASLGIISFTTAPTHPKDDFANMSDEQIARERSTVEDRLDEDKRRLEALCAEQSSRAAGTQTDE